MQKSLILRQNWNREISKRLQKQSLAKRNLFSRTTLWVAVQHWSSEWPRGDNPTPTSGVVAVFCWTSLKKISHIHGQRQQVLEQLRGDTPHPWQRRSLSKMVGGANSCLKSNPIPTRDAKRAQTNLVHTRAQGPHRDWESLNKGTCIPSIWGFHHKSLSLVEVTPTGCDLVIILVIWSKFIFLS